MFARLLARRSGRHVVDRLHGDIVAASRRPEFYTLCGAPDTFEGRFEVLTIHLSALVRRLERIPRVGRPMAQDLTDATFRNIDVALREIGVSDLGVPRRMKKLAGDYAGRSAAYARALAGSDPGALAAALARNVYPAPAAAQDPRVRALESYVRALEAALGEASEATLLEGRVAFPAPALGAAQ